MSYFGSSENYEWLTIDDFTLGRGSFGSVYKGVNKKTGEEVAVKAFHDSISQLPPEKRDNREFLVMKVLCHENIVKLIAIEEEIKVKKKVLIMELCGGGNLQQVLDDPQNGHGLEEKEFLCVLKDLTAGLKYLRENNYVHRDLKPANILKCVSEDGQTVYKLADFGSARYLEDSQEYQSVHGTVEYVYPDVLNATVLQIEGERAFKATTDLWSIGVTIYQLATGCVPFKPFLGRQDPETLKDIYDRLPSGFISGIQYGLNEPITWSRKLPETCLLNPRLRDLLTFLLAGIFERNKKKEWTYGQFFDCVTDITTRKIFHVFYMNEGKEICLYVHSQKKLKDLEKEISVHTEVDPSNQKLLFDKSLLSSQINPLSDVSSFPTTSLDQPLILIDRENEDMKSSSKFGVVSDVNDSPDNNASWERICCIKAYAMKRLVIKLARCQKLLLQIQGIYLSELVEKVSKLSSDLEILKLNMDAVRSKCELLKKTGSVVSHFLSAWPFGANSESFNSNVRIICYGVQENVSKIISSVDEAEKKFASLQSSIDVIKEEVLTSKNLRNKFEQTFSGCGGLDKCIVQANTYVEKICEIWQVFNPRKLRVLTSQEQHNLLRLERRKMKFVSSKLSILLKDECEKTVLQTLNKINPWHIIVQDIKMDYKCSKGSLYSLRDDLAKFVLFLEEIEIALFALAENIFKEFIPSIDSGLNSPPNLTNSDHRVPIKNGNFESDTVFQKLESFKEMMQKLRQAAEENSSLVESLSKLCVETCELNQNSSGSPSLSS